MSVVSPFQNVDWAGQLRTKTNHLTGLLFGDRVGVTLFLGSLAFLALYWRVGVFITDNWTIANTMVAVADGHLYVDRIVYGPGANTPGMHLVDERLYGRNYGHVVAALPFVWVLQGLATVADLRVAVVGLFSLVVLGFAVNLGALLDRRMTGALLGSVIALAAFGANLAVATPLSPRWIPLMALQVSTMAAMGFVGVVLYRLLARQYDHRVGLFAGAAAVLGTPLAFWASIPKRHVVSALLVVLVVYSFYRSRETTAPATETRFRALAYAWVGLLAWVHAAEALAVFIALAAVDVPTARANDARTLSVVAGAFLLSLLPFFLTNQLIAGNPIEPPRQLPGYHGNGEVLLESDGGASGGGNGGDADISGGSKGALQAGTNSADRGGAGGISGSNGALQAGIDFEGGGRIGGTADGTQQLIPPGLVAFVWDVMGKFALFASMFTRGVQVALTEPDRLYHTFVHSGYISRIAAEDGQQAINLALLESMSLGASLLAIPVVGYQYARGGVHGPRTASTVLGRIRTYLAGSAGQTDLFVGTSTLLLTLMYITRLPVHAMVTVRYLLPIVPGLVYLVIRLAPIRSMLRTQGRTLLLTWIGTVAIGCQVIVLMFLIISPSLGEAMQFHAWIGLAVAAAVGVWTIGTGATDRQYPRIGAVLLGIAVGEITIFLVLSGFFYFDYMGDFALPISQRVNDLIPVLK